MTLPHDTRRAHDRLDAARLVDVGQVLLQLVRMTGDELAEMRSSTAAVLERIAQRNLLLITDPARIAPN